MRAGCRRMKAPRYRLLASLLRLVIFGNGNACLALVTFALLTSPSFSPVHRAGIDERKGIMAETERVKSLARSSGIFIVHSIS